MAASRLSELLDSLRAYRNARRTFLLSLGCEASNRDPLAEFSEHVVAALMDGTLAQSRVQKGYDLITPDEARAQVRYLANPSGAWVNEHLVDFRGDCDQYALVIFERLDPKSILVFDRNSLVQVGAALGKRHPSQDDCLQLTRRNYLQLRQEREQFGTLGVRIVDLQEQVIDPADDGSAGKGSGNSP